MASREQKGNGVVMPLEPLTARLKRGLGYALTGTADWFGPGKPLQPQAPEAVRGREFDLPVGINQFNTSKTEGIGFAQLRSFAYTTDIVRLLIETRKDQVCALDWMIAKKGNKTTRGNKKANIVDSKADELTDFFAYPDKEHAWEEWLRLILEDMFVIDAATLYPQRTRGGDLYALRPIDGGTIKRIVDTHGWTPLPPDPAYQQILKGVPATNYTSDELIYRPRNLRTNRLYGYSHVEQIVVTAKTWLLRQVNNLTYYEEGSVPDAVISAGEDWSASQIDEYEKLLNKALEGKLGERRKLRVVPHGSTLTQTKEPAFKNDYDEWLARIACFCFSVPPTAFIKEVSRATADTTNISALETGMGPLRKWVERYMTHLIQRVMGNPDYEFSFLDKEAEDPLERAQIDQIYVGAKVLSPDEIREDLGKEPLPNGAGEIQPAPDPNAPAPTDPGSPQSNQGGQPPKPRVGDRQAPKVGNPDAKKMRKRFGPFDLAACDHEDHTLLKVVANTAVEQKLTHAFTKMLGELAINVASQWKNGIKKAAGNPEDEKPTSAEAAQFAREVDLSAMSLVWDEYSNTLEAEAANGSKIALLRVKVSYPENVTDDMIGIRDPRAVKWAQEHAAEMIAQDGSGGELMDSTRRMIQDAIIEGIKADQSRKAIAESLVQAYAFAPERAELIAATEVRNAEGHGKLSGYKHGKLTEKHWLKSNDEGVCTLCEDNEAQGYIPIDDAFVSGAEAPLQHPRCRCDIIAR